jgi:hypothetical protein
MTWTRFSARTTPASSHCRDPCWRSGRSAPRSSTRAVRGKRFSEPSRSGPAPTVPAQDQCRTGIGVPASRRPGTGDSAHRVQLSATLWRGRSDLRPATAVPVQHQRVSHQIGAGVSPDSPGVRRRQRSYPRAGCCRSRDGGGSRLPPGLPRSTSPGDATHGLRGTL